MATRAVRGYRTISRDAACLLAGSVPWDLDTRALADVEWVDRKKGALSFRLTQVLTGHGCFGRYLCEIVGREETTRCHHCDDERDTAAHTLTACPSWTRQRAALTTAIGPDLSLPALVSVMLTSEQKSDVEKFTEEIISNKEQAERDRGRRALDPLRPRRRVIRNDNLPP
ncbi:uncharacterized protein LOC121733324 [Aricia agestis]|uniref:uncharacterized protein LOC121733324 n=1 Tax=Aricia agestis TaxID=91739 RepID=UPI001C2065DB|nr:uncharacterized protein LOC121733324 [Aricia agestis]